MRDTTSLGPPGNNAVLGAKKFPPVGASHQRTRATGVAQGGAPISPASAVAPAYVVQLLAGFEQFELQGDGRHALALPLLPDFVREQPLRHAEQTSLELLHRR